MIKLQHGEKPLNVILLLHGYGASASNIIKLAFEWFDDLHNVIFIAPNATFKIDENSFFWFKISDFNKITQKELISGIKKSRVILSDIIEKIRKEYNPIHIIPVGFSQGGMLALDLLAQNNSVYYAISYSGAYFPLTNLIVNSNQKKALLVHGNKDDRISYDFIDYSKKNLLEKGIITKTVTCKGLGHSINELGILEGKKFFKEVL